MAIKDDRDSGALDLPRKSYEHKCATCGSSQTDSRENRRLCPEEPRHGQMTVTVV